MAFFSTIGHLKSFLGSFWWYFGRILCLLPFIGLLLLVYVLGVPGRKTLRDFEATLESLFWIMLSIWHFLVVGFVKFAFLNQIMAYLLARFEFHFILWDRTPHFKLLGCEIICFKILVLSSLFFYKRFD